MDSCSSDRAVLREPEAAVRDRELLDLAALASGYVIESFASDGGCWAYVPGSRPNGDGEPPLFKWHPRGDDGDALRLAVRLGIDLQLFRAIPHEWRPHDRFARACVDRLGRCYSEQIVDDPGAATRRAIVRAAAAIGSELRKTASGCSHTARSDDQSKVDDQEPTAGSSHG